MSRLNIIFLIVFVGLIVGISLFKPDAVQRIQNGAQVAMSPFIEASSRVDSGLEAVSTEPLSPAQLNEQIALLKQERDRLKLEAMQTEKLLVENNQLRRALNYTERSERNVIPARILSRKPTNWYSTMIIDKGDSHGISVDSPVIVPVGEEAGLVGKVTEVISENSSVVLLLTDEMCQVSARLEGSQEQGIVSGERGAFRSLPNLKLSFLSKEADAGTGRRVTSSGAGGLFPPDLLLGEVIDLKIGTIDAEATIAPSVNFDALTDVFVVRPAIPKRPIEGETSETPAGEQTSVESDASNEASP
ncbi:MAG: rod shape-determining protein MreC [Verrucomicrobiota bacterium]